MSTQLITVPFHGNNLFITTLNDQPYTPMKPIVEGMGLDWKTQYRKLKQGDGHNDHTPKRWGVAIITTPTNGNEQDAICLPLRKLPGWLMTIHHNKVRPEIRDKIITYQNECDDALWDYWNKGVAVRQTSTLTKSQIGQLFDVVAKRSGADGQLRHYMWGRLKEHFGPYASYHDIPAGRFEEALQFLLGMSLHGHLQPEARKLANAAELLSPEQETEVIDRLDRLAKLFHPLSEQFGDILGICRAVRGLHPRIGMEEAGYRKVLSC